MNGMGMEVALIPAPLASPRMRLHLNRFEQMGIGHGVGVYLNAHVDPVPRDLRAEAGAAETQAHQGRGLDGAFA